MAVTTVGAAIAHLGVNTREWFNGLNKAQRRWVSFGSSLQVAGFRLTASLTAALGAVGALALKTGSDFERAFAGVRKTVDASDKQFALLEKGLRELALATGIAAKDLAEWARIGGQLGVDPSQLLGFTDALAKMSVAINDMEPEVVARSLAKLMAVTGESQANFGRLGSVLAMLGDNFATTEGQILDFATRISGLAKTADISAAELMGISAGFMHVRDRVESSATAVGKAIGKVIEHMAVGGEKMEMMAKVMGITADEFRRQWGENAADTFVSFVESLGTYGDKAVLILKELGLGNQRAIQSFMSMAGATGKLREALAMARKEFEDNKKLNREFAVVMETVIVKFSVLKQIITEVGIKLFNAFKKQILGLLDTLGRIGNQILVLADWFSGLDEETKDWIVTIGLAVAALGPMLMAFGMLISAVMAIMPALSAIGGLLLVVAGVLYIVSLQFERVTGQSMGWLDVISLMVLGIGGLISFILQLGRSTVNLVTKIKQTAAEIAEIIDESLNSLSGYLPGVEIWGAIPKKVGAAFKSMGSDWKEWEATGKEYTMMIDGVQESTIEFANSIDRAGRQSNRAREELEKIKKALEETGMSVDDADDVIEKLTGGIKDFETGIKEIPEHIKAVNEELRNLGFDARVGNISTGEASLFSTLLGLTPEALARTKTEIENAITMFSALTGKNLTDGMRKELEGPLDKLLIDAFQSGDSKLYQEVEALGARLGIRLSSGFVGPLIPEELLGQRNAESSFVGPVISDDMRQIREEEERANEATKSWNKALSETGKLMRALGMESNAAVGSLLTMGNYLGNMLSTEKGRAQFMGGGEVFGGEDGFNMGAATTMGISGAAGIVGATGSGSRSQRVLGGAAAGASAGAMAGPIGAAVGAGIGAIVGMFRGGKVLKAMKDLATKFGHEVSEELAEAIVESSKSLGSMENAISANLGDIISEVGVDQGNIGEMTGAFGNLIGMIENGTLAMGAMEDQLSVAFTEIVAHLQTLGSEGSLQIGELVNTMLDAGVVTDELRAHLETMIGLLSEQLAPALAYINELQGMTREEAEAYQGVILAAFGAAVAQTGSFIEAVKLLGEEFGSALGTIMEILGEDGENLVGPIAEIYNIISNNQMAFDALSGIIGSLDTMAQMGILTKESLAQMGEAARVTFERIATETGNMNATLKASWPELVKLYDQYRVMGEDVPKWLQDAIDKGEQMGLSMEMPLSTEQAMAKMLEVLVAIGIALGANVQHMKDFNREAANAPVPPTGGGGRPSGNAQTGFHAAVDRPMTITVGETGMEQVDVTPGGGGGSGGGGPLYSTLNIDGVTFGEWISEATKDGKVRVHPTAVREF